MGRARRAASTPPPEREQRDYTHLPERILPEQMRTVQDLDPGPDPQGGRDTETEFMLRHIGGF